MLACCLCKLEMHDGACWDAEDGCRTSGDVEDDEAHDRGEMEAQCRVDELI